MKKKRNGFIFVETIITVSVLTISLLIVYRAFSNAIDTEKRRLSQDSPVYLYRTYYILDFLQRGGLDNYIDYIDEYNAHYQKISCESRIDESMKSFCTSILSNEISGVENVYILNNNIKEILDIKSELNNFTNTAIDYIRTFNNILENEYLIMVEYKENCRAIKNSDDLDEDVQNTDSDRETCDYNYASIKVSGDSI